MHAPSTAVTVTHARMHFIELVFMISNFLELRPKLLLYFLTARSQNHMRNFLKSYWSSYSKDTVFLTIPSSTII